MPDLHRYWGTWTARVEQDFEVEAESEAAALKLIEEEMTPSNVVELTDFEVTSINEEEIDA